MEALAGWNIHVAKRGDTLVFHYPHVKDVTIDRLESVTGYRLGSNGHLVDSIYDIREEDGMLKLKFHYAGTDSKENRFSLNLVPIDKAEFLAAVSTLKEERKQLMDKVEPVQISGLDLSIPRPAYCNEKDLAALTRADATCGSRKK